MIYKIILIISLVVHVKADVFKVKCGDEKCERPANSAVTTLRYTPDKPFKLQINAVNAEVDIYGMTDDLYFCRFGKNYGFLPKKHLREKFRGNFPFELNVDLTNRKIDQSMREQNFVYLILSASQQEQKQVEVNETKIQEEKIDPQKTDEIKVPDPPQQLPVANDSPPLDTTTTNRVPDQVIPKQVDSGIEDNDEDDEDDEDDEEDEIPKKTQPDQPELVAIPPTMPKIDEAQSLPPTPANIVEVPKDVEQTTPTPVQDDLTSTTVLPDSFDNMFSDNETIPQEVQKEPAPVNEIVSEIEIQATTELPPVDDAKMKTEEIVIPIKVEEEQTTTLAPPVMQETTTEIPESMTSMEINDSVEELTIDLPKNETVEVKTPEVQPEIVTTTPEPEPQTIESATTIEEKIVESTTHTVPQVFETTTTTQPEVVGTSTQQPAEIVEEVTTNKPETFEIVEDLKNIKDETVEPIKVDETPETIVNPGPRKLEPDALMKRLREKFDNRKKDDKKPEEQHSHAHDHSHHDHEHSHHDHHDHQHHVHEEPKIPSPPISSIDAKIEDDDDEPGFFGGIYKKFFGETIEEELKIGTPKVPTTETEEFCEKIDSENCPKHLQKRATPQSNFGEIKSTDELLKMLLTEMIESVDLIISIGLTAVTVLIFTLGYYCITKAKKEGPLIGKINELERHLMASMKENELLRNDITSTKQKLMSIEDNSFGSNDMVVALKKEIESSESEKQELFEKIDSLESQLETATEDALELNKMVSELLNNQTGSETILSTVEELQRQLNEQQETITTVNDTLAIKSRENSELLMQLSAIEEKQEEELRVCRQGADAITLERNNLLIELENLKHETDVQLNQLVEERNSEVTRLNNELTNYIKKYEESKKNFISAESKAQAFEECLSTVKKGGEFKDIFDVADLKADLLAVTKEKSTIQEVLQHEKDARKLLDDRVKAVSEEMSNLKIEFGVAEKEKLEAQTRLEVLSTYFKDKETQLQKELSLKEALWMKSQGETTNTVEKIQALNDEVQQLKSQNESLRVEIEAQAAAHKLNISSHEAQSHTAWLNARQAERRLEESRMEAAALRRRLTSIAENPASTSDVLNGLGVISDTMNSIPSPIRVESPNNPNQMQPPPPMMLPPFLPQGFMPGAPPPFLPPFMPPPGDLPPLGRLMSPPPKRFTSNMRDERDRYSPRGRGRYSPDSRYEDTAFETETDFSPPATPSPPLRRGYNSQSDRSKKSTKGGNSSGSVDSNPNPRRKK